jgi:2-polyprenyl-3-methyl-5-hydroxy-6-metoxy-1,4-benzoquinol methylase
MTNLESTCISLLCPMCGADDVDVVYNATSNNEQFDSPDAYRCTNPGYGTHDRIVRCRRCRLVYSNPRSPDNVIIENYKAVEDMIYVHEQDGRRLTFMHHIKHMETIIGKPNGRSLIDVGCYTGVFVEVALNHGWKTIGIEPSHWAAAYAQSRNLPVIEGMLATAGIADASQDVVTLWDVIEHLPDPMRELQLVARILKPGGWIVIHTMDIDSLAARIMRECWPWLMKMHLIYFSQRTMADMLRKVAAEPVYSKAMGRYLRLGYFSTRVMALSPRIGRIFSYVVNKTNLHQLPIPLNFGDLFTVYARKNA